MTELVTTGPEVLVDPTTGELTDATPAQAALLLKRLRDVSGNIRAALKDCEAVLAAESARVGSKTLRIEGLTLELYGDHSVEWDEQMLRDLLERAGCPDDRIAGLIRMEITYKVDARVAKQLAAANKTYADIIEAARQVHEMPQRVRVKQ